jgi:hypothetical protein
MSDARSKKDDDLTKKTSIVKDETLRDLQDRYKMDEEIWTKSKRGFPFNIPLWFVVALALGTPIASSFLCFESANAYLWKVYLFTLAISAAAYFVTDKAIE